MPGNQEKIGSNQDRIHKAEFLDAIGNQSDLLLVVSSRIGGTGDHAIDRQLLNLTHDERCFHCFAFPPATGCFKASLGSSALAAKLPVNLTQTLLSGDVASLWLWSPSLSA